MRTMLRPNLRGDLGRCAVRWSSQFEVIPVDRLDGLAVVEFDPPAAWRPAPDNHPFPIAVFRMSVATEPAHPDAGTVEKTRHRQGIFEGIGHLGRSGE